MLITNQVSPRLELRAYRPHPGLSQETIACTATLYVDGKRTASVSNAGHGGPNDIDEVFNKGQYRVFRDIVTDHPGIDDTYGHLDMSEDFALGLLIDYAQKLNDFKKWTRNGVETVFRVAGDGHGNYRVYPGNWVECKQYIIDRYGAGEMITYHKREKGKGGHAPSLSTQTVGDFDQCTASRTGQANAD